MELSNIRKNNLFKFISLLLILFILMSVLCSCKKKDDVIDNTNINIDNTIFPEEMKGILNGKKIYITSIGQSGDITEYKEVVLDNASYIEYTMDTLLNASDVEDDSVVLLFVGCSIKALARSELTIDDELKRASEFCTLSQKNKITLICFHIGGETRRGATSDQFIKALFPYSKMNIYLDRGNEDNLLSDLSHNNNVYCYEISSTLALSKTTEMLYYIGE